MRNCKPCDTGVLGTVTDEVCIEDFYNIRRMFFQKLDTPPYKFVTEAAVSVQSNWTTLFTAVDDTKVIVTPVDRMLKVTFTPGAPEVTTETPTGEERIMDVVKKTRVSGMFVNLSAAQYASLVDAFCQYTSVYFVDGQGNIIAKKVTTTDIEGFPILPGSQFLSEPQKDDSPLSPLMFPFNFNMGEMDWFSKAAKYETNWALTVRV